jgi:hypothetical protein
MHNAQLSVRIRLMVCRGRHSLSRQREPALEVSFGLPAAIEVSVDLLAAIEPPSAPAQNSRRLTPTELPEISPVPPALGCPPAGLELPGRHSYNRYWRYRWRARGHCSAGAVAGEGVWLYAQVCAQLEDGMCVGVENSTKFYST